MRAVLTGFTRRGCSIPGVSVARSLRQRRWRGSGRHTRKRLPASSREPLTLAFIRIAFRLRAAANGAMSGFSVCSKPLLAVGYRQPVGYRGGDAKLALAARPDRSDNFVPFLQLILPHYRGTPIHRS